VKEMTCWEGTVVAARGTPWHIWTALEMRATWERPKLIDPLQSRPEQLHCFLQRPGTSVVPRCRCPGVLPAVTVTGVVF